MSKVKLSKVGIHLQSTNFFPMRICSDLLFLITINYRKCFVARNCLDFGNNKAGYTPECVRIFYYIYIPDFSTDTHTAFKVTHTQI